MKHYAFGEEISGQLTTSAIHDILNLAKNRQSHLAAYPLRAIVSVFEKLARKLREPALRKNLIDELAASSPFSPEMIALGIDALSQGLSAGYNRKKIIRDLGHMDAFETFMWTQERNQLVRCVPRGLSLHIAAGNVFLTPVLSAVEGLLAKSTPIVKLSSGTGAFPLRFSELLRAVDDDGIVSTTCAFLHIASSEQNLLTQLKQEVDTVIAWGGESAILAAREHLPLKTTSVEYGPKLSCAVITLAGLARDGATATATALAKTIALWDQQACSSPQVLYLEQPASAAAKAFIEALSTALEAEAHILPMAALSLDEQSEITKERELRWFQAAQGQGDIAASDNGIRWTLLVEDDATFAASPLNRTLRIKPLTDLAALGNNLSNVEHFLQTVGICADPLESAALMAHLSNSGALRFTTVGYMLGSIPGEPHDGISSLSRLVRLVSAEAPLANSTFSPLEILPATQLDQLIDAKIEEQFMHVTAHSAFYRERFQGLRCRNAKDLRQLPVMTKADIQGVLPPRGESLLCGQRTGGYMLRTGGSTGAPYYSLYTMEDVQTDMEVAARGPFAVGLRKGDRVASLFWSGSLYGSFISSLKIAEIMQCEFFALTGNAEDAYVLQVLRDFNIQTVTGVPSSFLRFVRRNEEAVRALNLRRLLYAGEHVYEQDRAYLRDFGISEIQSFGYGAVDGGPIGYQCLSCTGTEHHVFQDHTYVEILRENNEICEPGEAGSVVITNLNRRLMPLIRFAIGDQAMWLAEPCSCGRTAPRLKLLARKGPLFKCARNYMNHEDFAGVAHRAGGLGERLQARIYRMDTGDALCIRTEAQQTAAIPDAENLRQCFLREIPVLKRCLNDGSLRAFTVEVLPPGGLPIDTTSGKVRSIVDERQI